MMTIGSGPCHAHVPKSLTQKLIQLSKTQQMNQQVAADTSSTSWDSTDSCPTESCQKTCDHQLRQP